VKASKFVWSSWLCSCVPPAVNLSSAWIFSSTHCSQILNRDWNSTAPYPMGTGCSFPGGKAAGAWSWPLTSIQCRGQECVELYLHSSIRLHGVVLSEAERQLYILPLPDWNSTLGMYRNSVCSGLIHCWMKIAYVQYSPAGTPCYIYTLRLLMFKLLSTHGLLMCSAMKNLHSSQGFVATRCLWNCHHIVPKNAIETRFPLHSITSRWNAE
jgi:hypothetical protein